MMLIQDFSKITDGAYVVKIDEYKSIGSHWIALYANGGNVTFLTVLKLNIFQRN